MYIYVHTYVQVQSLYSLVHDTTHVEGSTMAKVPMPSDDSDVYRQYNLLSMSKWDTFSVADPGRGKGGASVPPFGLHLTLRSTDDRNPPFWL